jgi:SMC interacting uncharacterized protein involved in chromosome segregation|tara:strand:+ start:333 stop:509 length:177 start_codon:yes stop_codon:yes gene_type:complete
MGKYKEKILDNTEQIRAQVEQLVKEVEYKKITVEELLKRLGQTIDRLESLESLIDIDK